jgi:hypothetical protein
MPTTTGTNDAGHRDDRAVIGAVRRGDDLPADESVMQAPATRPAAPAVHGTGLNNRMIEAVLILWL